MNDVKLFCEILSLIHHNQFKNLHFLLRKKKFENKETANEAIKWLHLN